MGTGFNAVEVVPYRPDINCEGIYSFLRHDVAFVYVWQWVTAPPDPVFRHWSPWEACYLPGSWQGCEALRQGTEVRVFGRGEPSRGGPLLAVPTAG